MQVRNNVAHRCRAYFTSISVEDHHSNLLDIPSEHLENRAYGEQIEQDSNRQWHTAMTRAQHRHRERIQATLVHLFDNAFKRSVQEVWLGPQPNPRPLSGG